ncbi:response regulator FixJ [Methylocapsa aurea]|uniref:response regulator FixJ n=1 Tax=Methylocapsa aurea TaxID=663610 RepID=UPI00055E114C|nr:response regulator FixJ [Methylocapsa aurea]
MACNSTVHVIDDDPALRDSLDFLLASAGFSVKLFESGEAFLETLPSLSGGCVVTDVRMQGVDGIELVRRLRQTHQAMPVIVITGHGDVPLAVKAMKLGATDFMEKPFDGEALVAAVRSAVALDAPSRPANCASDELTARLASLSQRESQVLHGLMNGHTNKEIARQFDLSPRTVEVYRAKLMTKMEAGSISELVRLAIKAGISGV